MEKYVKLWQQYPYRGIQYTGTNDVDVIEFVSGYKDYNITTATLPDVEYPVILLNTKGVTRTVYKGDWVVAGFSLESSCIDIGILSDAARKYEYTSNNECNECLIRSKEQDEAFTVEEILARNKKIKEDRYRKYVENISVLSFVLCDGLRNRIVNNIVSSLLEKCKHNDDALIEFRENVEKYENLDAVDAMLKHGFSWDNSKEGFSYWMFVSVSLSSASKSSVSNENFWLDLYKYLDWYDEYKKKDLI